MTIRHTIFALSTGHPPSAIAMVRISGIAVQDLARMLLPKGLPPARHAVLTPIHGLDGHLIDRGVAVYFQGPYSYTGEDLLELSVHGGPAILDDLLATLEHVDGVRLAAPGEFTRRAFEAGKLDLTEAEAVADLVDAETAGQRDQALAQLDGALKRAYGEWRRLLLEALALIEIAVDFPDEADAPDHTDAPVLERLVRLETALTEALADDQVGERIRDGFRVALVGAPNAGKSSLLNRLAGRDAAIVTDIPGTTRDVVEVRLKLGGHLVRLSDTAGIRDSADPIEEEGIRRAKQAASDADLRILVLDATAAEPHIPPFIGSGDMIVENKSDLATGRWVDVSRETLSISARTGAGIDVLVDGITDRIRQRIDRAPSPLITRARHRTGLSAALGHIGAAKAAIGDGMGAEFAAEDVRRAIQELSELMGHIDVEEVLGAIFAEFCIGK